MLLLQTRVWQSIAELKLSFFIWTSNCCAHFFIGGASTKLEQKLRYTSCKAEQNTFALCSFGLKCKSATWLYNAWMCGCSSYSELAILCNKTGLHQKLPFPFKSTNSNFNTYVASFVSLWRDINDPKYQKGFHSSQHSLKNF